MISGFCGFIAISGCRLVYVSVALNSEHFSKLAVVERCAFTAGIATIRLLTLKI